MQPSTAGFANSEYYDPENDLMLEQASQEEKDAYEEAHNDYDWMLFYLELNPDMKVPYKKWDGSFIDLEEYADTDQDERHMDDEPESWIEINGKRIPFNEEGILVNGQLGILISDQEGLSNEAGAAPLDENKSEDRVDDDDWITIKGTHVLLNKEGVAQGGGKLEGMSFKDAKSQKKAVQYKRPAAQDKSLRNIAKKTAGLKKEQYRIVDQDGNVLLEKKGGKNSVAATVGEKRAHMNGAVSIHNHPDGGSFSTDDLDDFGYGAYEIMVSTPEGIYTLTNTKINTKDQYSGWLDMKRRIEEEIPEVSPIALRKQARKNMEDTDEAREMKRITEEWVKLKDSGASFDEQRAFFNESGYENYEKAQKAKINAEVRRLEVEPFDTFYREHAEEYGFKYTFEPSPKKDDSTDLDRVDESDVKLYSPEFLSSLYQEYGNEYLSEKMHDRYRAWANGTV